MIQAQANPKGQWIIGPKKLQEMPLLQFLVDMRLRSVQLDALMLFGSKVDKHLKSRIKKLHNTALNSAAKSTNEQLSKAAKELNSLVPIDISRPEYQTVVVKLWKNATTWSMSSATTSAARSFLK
jgi:hypothetical protein